MNCEQVRELMPDMIGGTVPEGLRTELAAHLEACAACRSEHQSLLGLWNGLAALPELTPSAAMDRRFERMLRAYRAGLREARDRASHGSLVEWLRQWWPARPAWQLAALVVLFGAGLLAGWSLGPARGNESGSRGETMAELRREVSGLKEQVALALLQQKSAGERLRGVEWTSRLEHPDEQVLGALLRALETDPNVNVRLAAVGALEPFARQALVRRALLAELPRQRSPLVQAELIQLLVEAEDRESVPVLRSMSENQEVDDSVREQARWALAQLG